jgi:hypothetical protein
MYQEIEKKILNDLPVAPFYCNDTEHMLAKPYVKGFTLAKFVKLWKDIWIVPH